MKNLNSVNVEKIYNEIAILIEEAKRNVAIRVNSEITMLYWNIGRYITKNILNNEKPEYGKAVIESLSKRLIVEYGKGYGVKIYLGC